MIQFSKIDFEKNMETCVEFRKDAFKSSFLDSQWKTYWNEEQYRTWIISHAERFPDGALHLWDDGEIIGQLEFAYIEDSGYVNLYYLREDKRGKEYALHLHNEVMKILKDKGCKSARLRVSSTNFRAMKYYEKHGWKDCGVDEKDDNLNLLEIDLDEYLIVR